MSKGKIIIGCLDGGFSFWELRKWRTYLSEVAKDAMRSSSFEHKASRDLFRAKGVMLDVPLRFHRRSVRRVYRHVEENASSANSLVLLGKSSGAYNWVSWLADNADVVARYGWAGAVFVDANIGPRAENRNGETLDLRANLAGLANLYTKDPRFGGYMIRLNGSEEVNYHVSGRDHFDVCKSEMVRDTVLSYLWGADRP